MRFPAILALVIFLNISAVSQAGWKTGKILSVLDGETVLFESSTGSKYTVRIAGIDAPEPGQPFFDESAAALSSLLANKDVEIKIVLLDASKRSVGKVLFNKVDIGLLQIAIGFPRHRKSKGELTESENDEYSKAQLEAEKTKVGLWQQALVDPAQLTYRPHTITPSKPKEIFIGVVGHSLYYRPECDEVVGVPQRVFDSEEDAIAAGYKRASKCSPHVKPLPQTNNSRSLSSSPFPSAIRTLRAIRIIQVTSDYSSYADKIVTFEGEIKMSSYFVGAVDVIEDQIYAFSISDGTDSVMAYTPKTSGEAARLRNRLLKTDGASSRAKVQIQILGRSGGTVYGKLLNFVLYDWPR